ncbi:MAG TPA: SpoIIE family protein phosphatase [Candidatus Baltobacteraceae bacterium]|jgi:CHASE3 domain sensor protein|nr:SpoIIE family protein phosphatase [Candidatus Baltobacteraceae bacterium]
MKIITREEVRPLAMTVLMLIFVIPVLIIGLFAMRDQVTRTFRNTENVDVAQHRVFLIRTDQLNEETGMRGFAATHRTIFLEPYHVALSVIGRDFDQFETELLPLNVSGVSNALTDARTTNAVWLHTVAEPILAGSLNSTDLQLRGKELVDRFRRDMQRIDVLIQERGAVLDNEAELSIDHIGFLLLVSVIALVVFGFASFRDRLLRLLAGEKRSSANLRVLFETEKRISNMLQEAFLQKPLPTFSAMSLSATYVAASDTAKIGGDWYESLELSEGRVLFAVGDVVGHGLDAAVSMNRARQALISSAVVDIDPGSLLARVNADLLHQHEAMVTAVCGYADSRNYRFTYATAGHPPPVLLEPGQSPRFLQGGGLPMASIKGAEYRSRTVQTVPGAMLVLYTDGAVEYSRDVLVGEKLLLDAITGAAGDGSLEPAIAIRDALFRERNNSDDVAIMTIAFERSPRLIDRAENIYDDAYDNARSYSS